MEEKEYLIDWFSKNSDISVQYLIQNIDKNYFDLQWLDSFKFITLITCLEAHFGITFNNEEFQDPSFVNIEGLSNIIKAKRQ